MVSGVEYLSEAGQPAGDVMEMASKGKAGIPEKA